ncbi:MAG: lectin like domain-containing protein, partial [Methanomicrobiales archaeon]|nr:lectin like domain-containing protein [Methanomicrobiales archaeon]
MQRVIVIPPRSGPTDNANIKSAIQTYGGVATNIHIVEDRFDGSTKNYYYSGSTCCNHVLTLVGWDDYYSRANFVTPPPGNGAWIAKNSWGSNVHDAGYLYISYYDTNVGYQDTRVFTAEPVTGSQHVYLHDPLGWSYWYGQGQDTLWTANVFTAQRTEEINAVSFYTPLPSTAYKVYLSTSLDSPQTRPVGSTYQVSQTGTIALPGYSTIAVPNPPRVSQGQKFSVVVYLHTDGFNFPMAVEMPRQDWSSRATAHSGESFASPNGVDWSDVTQAFPNANFCIRAFTRDVNPVPVITRLNPEAALARGPAFTLTVTGTGFVSGSKVRWNGVDRTTHYVSATTLTADIPATDIMTAGTVSVTVFNPTPGGGTSNAVSFAINNPVPAISGISPVSATAGGTGFTLTVTGTGFVPGSRVRWNGVDRTTGFSSTTRLTATIPASDIATGSTAAVTVFTAAPGGGTSGAATFTVNNPVPVISSTYPTSAKAGGSAFTLTVYGSGFVSGSKVRWNGADLTTTYFSKTKLTASIPASHLATAGTAAVTVFSPAPGGGTSGAVSFPVNNPVPVLSSISPTSAQAGGPAFTLTVTGSGFVAGSRVRWKGVERTTHSVSATSLTADIPAADIATAGSATVTVFNPSPGGGSSYTRTFTITQPTNPAPVLSGISPASAVAGGPAMTLTVTGSGFISTSKVRWKGVDRTTHYVSATSLTADITAADIASVGSATVTVFNPAPGGGTSTGNTFTITSGSNPAPTLSGISPASATAGGPAFTLTVTGTGFVGSSKVRWNGGDRTTHFSSATTLTADIPATDIATAGTATVTVFNPAPGGGTSAGKTFTISQPSGNPLPVLSSISPASATVGGSAFTLTATGSGFVSGSKLRWNGVDRTTHVGSSTTLTADIPAADIAATGTATVTVFNPA